MNGEATEIAEKFKFKPVKDSRGREIDGLWERNGRYYVQVHVPGKGSRRFCLTDDQHQPIRDPRQAADAAVEFRNKKRDGEMPESGRAPKFKDYYEKVYIKWLKAMEAKDPKTIYRELRVLTRWAKSTGETRITHITRQQINDHVLKRKTEDKVGNRTLNLDVGTLANMLYHAKNVDGWIKGELVTDSWKQLDDDAPVRTLVTREDMQKIFDECLRQRKGFRGAVVPVYRNGELLADLLKFMCYSGARIDAATKAKWSDVDWKNEQLHLTTKYKKHVVVDMNPLLQAHLKDMHSRRIPDSPWVFPSTMSHTQVGHIGEIHRLLGPVREAAGFPNFTPHDCRHHFISYAVMEGIDYLTIAKWVGHSDGGVLIGKVYGHLAPGHTKRLAARFTFGEKLQAPQAPASASPSPAPAAADVASLSAADLLALLQQKLASEAAAPAGGHPAGKTPAGPQP